MLSMPLKLYAFALLIKYATTIVPGPACVPIVDPSCDTGISPITPSQVQPGICRGNRKPVLYPCFHNFLVQEIIAVS